MTDQALIDGNKRLGWVSVRLFCRLNDPNLHAPVDGAFDVVASIAARLWIWVVDLGTTA